MDHTKSPPSSVPCPVSGERWQRALRDTFQRSIPSRAGSWVQHPLEPRLQMEWQRWDIHMCRVGSPAQMLPFLGWSWVLLVPGNSSRTPGMLPQQLQAAQQGWVSPGRSRASPPGWAHTALHRNWGSDEDQLIYLLSFHLPLPCLGVTPSLSAAHTVFLFNSYSSKKTQPRKTNFYFNKR